MHPSAAHRRPPGQEMCPSRPYLTGTASERQQAQQQSPQLHRETPPSPRISAASSPLTADLAATVQQLLDGSLRGIEERLHRAICPLLPHPPQATAAGADNISLPSQTPAPQRPSVREPTANQQLHEPVELDEMDVPPPTNPQRVQQPPVLARVRQRIVGGEFVDLDNLLHDSLFPARYRASTSPSLALRVVHDRSTSGEVLIAQQRSEWCATWHLVWRLGIRTYPYWWPTTRLGRSNCLPTSALFATPARVSPPTAGCGTTPTFAHALWRTDPCAGTASTTIYGWSASLATLPPRDPHLST